MKSPLNHPAASDANKNIGPSANSRIAMKKSPNGGYVQNSLDNNDKKKLAQLSLLATGLPSEQI